MFHMPTTPYEKNNPNFPNVTKKVMAQSYRYDDADKHQVHKFLHDYKFEVRIISAIPVMYVILRHNVVLYGTGKWFADDDGFTGDCVNSLHDYLQAKLPNYYNYEKLKDFFMKNKPMYHTNHDNFVCFDGANITVYSPAGHMDSTQEEFMEWFSEGPHEFVFKEQLEHKDCYAYERLTELEGDEYEG